MILLRDLLALFFVWETVLSVVPWTIPAWLQPLLVYGTALALCWPDWRLALAVSGAVALLHVVVVQRPARDTPPKSVTELQRPPRTRLPNLP